MLKRILSNHEILYLILNNERKYKHLVISDDEKISLNDSWRITGHFGVIYDITERISVEQIGTSSVIIPSILLLTKENEEDSQFESDFKEILNHYITFYDEKFRYKSKIS